MQKIKLLKKSDIILAAIVAVVCAAALIYMGSSGQSLTATVSVDGEIYDIINLSGLESEIVIVTPTDPETVIKASKNAIWFENSQCDNQLCVNSGKLSKNGAAAACLPAKTVITVEGAEKPVDAVTY